MSKLDRVDAAELTDDQLSSELDRLSGRWDALMRSLEESGGAAGSPGEWLSERISEVECEIERRVKETARKALVDPRT